MDNTPKASDMWIGIGGHFSTLTEVLCEFIDNSISNYQGNNIVGKSITININELVTSPNDMTYRITIEDAGTGIKNLEASFTIGCKDAQESLLNEHGFGFKHALATANPENNAWEVYTRTKEDFDIGRYFIIEAPYDFGMQEKEMKTCNSPWPGQINGCGTYVKFDCMPGVFDLLQRGIRGKAGFEKCLDYLLEDLGYIYSGIIKSGIATITVNSPQKGYSKSVAIIEPSWAGFYSPNAGYRDIDLGNGSVKVEYKFGEISESPYTKYYKKSMSTSGLELRVNGRLILSNIFKDIWERENHPSYNHFLAIINLVTDKSSKLPHTKTSKNGIKTGDPKLEKLFDWVRSVFPDPPKKTAGAVSEAELVDEYRDKLEAYLDTPDKKIEREFKVYNSFDAPVSVDLYVYDGFKIKLFEAKKDKADAQAVYQLLMYWDGAVYDGLKPDEGIVMASDFSDGVDYLIDYLNQKTDANGNKYNFKKATWKSVHIDYPQT